jgi:hypothetical protein
MKVGERANAELTGDTLEEARSFLELLRAERVIDTQTYRRRLDQISCAVVRRGHYWMESSELEHACRVAWRQSSRCIGRLLWKTLIVRDCRELVTPEEIFGACVDHLRLAANGGRIPPVMSIFAADRDQLHAMTTLVLGSWVRAFCQPGSVRGGPDRSPGGCGARCTKHHAGTHRREIESACQNTNTRCREQCHLSSKESPLCPLPPTLRRTAARPMPRPPRHRERRRCFPADEHGGGRHPRPQYPGVDLDRPVRRRQGAGVVRRCRRGVQEGRRATGGGRPPPARPPPRRPHRLGLSPMPRPLTTDAHPDPRRWTTTPAPGSGSEPSPNSPHRTMPGSGQRPSVRSDGRDPADGLHRLHLAILPGT